MLKKAQKSVVSAASTDRTSNTPLAYVMRLDAHFTEGTRFPKETSFIIGPYGLVGWKKNKLAKMYRNVKDNKEKYIHEKGREV